MGLAPAKGTRPRAEVGRAVKMRQGWPDKAAGEGEADGGTVARRLPQRFWTRSFEAVSKRLTNYGARVVCAATPAFGLRSLAFTIAARCATLS